MILDLMVGLVFYGLPLLFSSYLFSRNTVKLFIRFIRVDYRIPILGITWSTRAKISMAILHL